jgi:hypothetical protein
MDGLQMLSARGPLMWHVDEDHEETMLTLPVVPTVEVRGASFSAASRDPEHRRFANIEAYFRQGHQSEFPCSLCVRVTVMDKRTGRYGLLWEEGKETPRVCSRQTWGISVASGTGSMVGGGADGFQCWTRFVVCPEPNQEGVAEEDGLYRLATGGDVAENDYHFKFMIDSTGIAQIGSMIRSLC